MVGFVSSKESYLTWNPVSNSLMVYRNIIFQDPSKTTYMSTNLDLVTKDLSQNNPVLMQKCQQLRDDTRQILNSLEDLNIEIDLDSVTKISQKVGS